MPGIAQLTAKEEEAVYHVIKGSRSTLGCCFIFWFLIRICDLGDYVFS